MKEKDQEEGSRDREMWVGDRLCRYRHNNQGMESCIRVKQPICSVQWQRRRCGPDLITKGSFGRRKWGSGWRGFIRSALYSRASFNGRARMRIWRHAQESNLRSYSGALKPRVSDTRAIMNHINYVITVTHSLIYRCQSITILPNIKSYVLNYTT